MPPLFTIEETAKALHVSVSLLHHLTAARAIAFTRLGRRLYFTEADLQAFIDSRRVEPTREVERRPDGARVGGKKGLPAVPEKKQGGKTQ